MVVPGRLLLPALAAMAAVATMAVLAEAIPAARAEPVAAATPAPAPAASDEELQAFGAAQSTFDDGLFELAIQRLEVFEKRFPHSALRTRSQLLTGRSYYYLGKLNAALTALEAPLPAAAPAFDELKAEQLLWQGEVLLALERYPEAEARFAAAMATPAAVPFAGAGQAELGRAWSLLRQGKTDEARKILTQLASRSTATVRHQAALLLARQEIIDGQMKSAAVRLQDLLGVQQLTPRVAFEAWYLLAEVYVVLQQPGDAMAAYKKVTGDKAAFPRDLVARAWYGMGRVHRVQEADLATASAAFEQAFYLADSEQMKLTALRSYLATSRERQALPEAVARLLEYARRNKGDDGPTLYAVCVALGESREAPQAISLLENYIAANPDSAWRAAAWYQLARLYQQEGPANANSSNAAPAPAPRPAAQPGTEVAKALKALDRCLDANPEPSLAVLAHNERASILLRLDKLPEALAEYEKAAAAAPALSSAAEDARFHVLSILARQGKADAFAKAEEQFAEKYPRSHYRSGIALLRGEMLERLGLFDQARKVYEKALQSLGSAPTPVPAAAAPASPSGAIQPATTTPPSTNPAPAALAGGSPATTAPAPAMATSTNTPAPLPTAEAQGSGPDRTMVLSGGAGQPSLALALSAPDSGERQSQLLIRLGDLLYKAGDLRGSRAAYQQLIATWPDDFHVPEASSKLVLDGLATKSITEDQAIAELLRVWERFPRHPAAPHLLFQIGELYFNRGDAVKAQTYFEVLAKDYPGSDLADDALYWAGLAAVSHGDLNEALAILQRIPDTSPRKTDSRFVQARIFHKLLKFNNAISLLEVVAAAEKTGPRYVEARIRSGDCHFQLALGEKDTAHYEKAAAAYGLIINGTQGTPAQRAEAGYKRALTLERLGRKQDALSLYLDVLSGRVQTPPAPAAASTPAARGRTTAATPRRPASSPAPAPSGALADGDAGDPTPPGTDLFWVNKAGLEAGRIKEEFQDWRGAIAIYKKLEQLGGPNAQVYHDMIMNVRREHYIYE